MKFFNRYAAYAPVVVRVAVSFVFLWFGISQLVNPESFLGYLPGWVHSPPAAMQHMHALQFLHDISGAPHWAIMGNGAFETLFGALLLAGLFTRISALLLSIHLALIGASLGYNDILIRDLGLALATFSVFLHGPDKFCRDGKVKLPGLLRKLVL